MLRKRKEYDMLGIVKWIGLLLVIIIVTSFSICFFAISIIEKETAKYADSVVRSYVRETEQLLDNIDSTMVSELIYDTNLDVIQLNKEQIKEIQALRTVKNLLVSLSHQNSYPVNYMIYFEDTGEAIDGSQTDTEYVKWRKVREDLIKVVVENQAYGEHSRVGDWNVVNIQGDSYVIKYYHYSRRFICSWIEIDEYINTLVMKGLGKQCYLVVSDKLGSPFNNMDTLRKDAIVIPEYKGEVPGAKRLFADSMIIQEPVKGTSFYMNAVITGYSEVASILKIQILLMGIVGVITVLCLLFMLYIRKTVIKPIQNFSDNLKKLKEDNNYNADTHYQIAELENANELLSNFIKQIKMLKIDIYERTLEKQKINMDFLSLQIKPHFFINCLNTIYHMVQIGRYKEVQLLTQWVSSYLRYICKNKENQVKFGEELAHVKDYLKIQNMRNHEGFVVEMNIEEEVMDVTIPPLIIQTFIENALKHAVDWESEITISLHGKRIKLEGEEFLQVIVEDTGEGFETDILQKLRAHVDISQGDKRIGINNAMQRLNLSYGGRARISFYNKATGGAGILIQVPIIKSESSDKQA